ncbi:MAG TPA: tryptophan synthase subunit alpha [Pyrinomonadaceae bacterium]|nr:tryptophan synthase subunit alpha [Pyrinomonadaceae bacterium]HMP64843.1 tryptophan synthase subunit alpha [Pyrinomonadaceae bacterium]
MKRIPEKFASLAADERKGFIPFLSAGDPDIVTSKEIVLTLANNGADIIELGVPFTDPMADGPTIQASSMRALENGVFLDDVLQMVREIRSEADVPIVLFSYLNPLHRYGIEDLAKDAAAAGVDGVLITDAVDTEAVEISNMLSQYGIDLISLIAPTTTDERLEKIAASAMGFIYAVSRAGVTGAQTETADAAELLVRRARRFTDLPIAVGFGISTREQIEDVWKYADAAVVGSAIVAEIERSIAEGDTLDRVRNFVRGLLPPFANRAAEP